MTGASVVFLDQLLKMSVTGDTAKYLVLHSREVVHVHKDAKGNKEGAWGVLHSPENDVVAIGYGGAPELRACSLVA